MAQPAETAAPSLRDVARECLRQSATQREAANKLIAAVLADDALRDALMTPWIDQAATALISSVQRDGRRVIWERPSAPDGRVVALRSAASAMLLDFPLPGGIRLRNATAEDLAEAVAFYAGQAADMAHKARWLSAVRDALGDGENVADAMDEAALRAMQENTSNG